MKKYLELVISGKKEASSIDDFVRMWYRDLSSRERLYDYLGISKKEYSEWVEGTDIETIVGRHR